MAVGNQSLTNKMQQERQARSNLLLAAATPHLVRRLERGHGVPVDAQHSARDCCLEAAVRARARLLLPDALDRGSRLLWATSDTLWRAIGDTSTDGNFYSKRAILSGVYASTLAMWLNETDPAKPAARAFLDRRIQNVMEFEKTKFKLRKATAGLPDVLGLLGKLRYGPGPRV